MITYAQVVIVALMVESFRRYRSGRERTERLERHLAEARLEALQMQLQPHFLFNTLNAIASLIHVNPAQADKMVSRLGDLLRAALNHSHLHEVTLAEELAFLEKYLDIEQVRFGDRLEVRFEIDAAVRDVLVPNLILQPLVENAIRHGISQRPGPGQILIRAHAAADETAVAIEVCDNGVGLEGVARRGLGRRAGKHPRAARSALRRGGLPARPGAAPRGRRARRADDSADSRARRGNAGARPERGADRPGRAARFAAAPRLARRLGIC